MLRAVFRVTESYVAESAASHHYAENDEAVHCEEVAPAEIFCESPEKRVCEAPEIIRREIAPCYDCECDCD